MHATQHDKMSTTKLQLELFNVSSSSKRMLQFFFYTAISIRKTMFSAFFGLSRFRFLVTTSPAFEKRRSLGTDVAGMLSIILASMVTRGNGGSCCNQ
jgi:hypothetical protein